MKSDSRKGLTPWTVLGEAMRRVPAIRYVLCVAALAAVVAIVRAWQLDLRIAAIGSIAVLLLAVVILVFARMSSMANAHFRRPAIVLMWFCVVLFMAICLLLVSCIFFRVPAVLPSLFSIPSSSVVETDRPRAATVDGSISFFVEHQRDGKEAIVKPTITARSSLPLDRAEFFINSTGNDTLQPLGQFAAFSESGSGLDVEYVSKEVEIGLTRNGCGGCDKPPFGLYFKLRFQNGESTEPRWFTGIALVDQYTSVPRVEGF